MIMTDKHILTKEEIITKTKQLGMMHILYWMRKNVYRGLTSFYFEIPGYITKYPSVEEFIFSFINTENNLIRMLSEIEQAYKKRIKE